MKYCSKCKKWKSKSDFYNDKSTKDCLSAWCKICKNESVYKSRGKIYKPILEPKIDALGGYKISILKYTKQGEYKYTIVSTRGDIFKSNDKDKFLSKLQEVI